MYNFSFIFFASAFSLHTPLYTELDFLAHAESSAFLELSKLTDKSCVLLSKPPILTLEQRNWSLLGRKPPCSIRAFAPPPLRHIIPRLASQLGKVLRGRATQFCDGHRVPHNSPGRRRPLPVPLENKRGEQVEAHVWHLFMDEDEDLVATAD